MKFKKTIVAVAFLGLVCAPLVTHAEDPATSGSATNSAAYDTGVVYQNSSASSQSTTESLNVSTDTLKGFTASLIGGEISGNIWENDVDTAGAVGAIGGFSFLPPFGAIGGYMAGGFLNVDSHGYSIDGTILGGVLDVQGSLNVALNKTVANTVVNSQMAADMGSVQMTSNTAANAVSGNGLAGTLTLAPQHVDQNSAATFAVGGMNGGLYTANGVSELGGGGGYAAGAGSSNYVGNTFSGSIAGALH